MHLPSGVLVVGRAGIAAVRCDDPLLQPLHLQLEVDPDGSLRILQLAGRRPVTVDGVLLDGMAALSPAGRHTVDIGASLLVLDHSPQAPEPCAQLGPHVGQRRPVIRAGRVVPAWAPDPIPVPASEPDRGRAAGTLVPAFVGLAGAGALAAVLDQPMFLLFGAIGALVGVASWAAQRCGLIRDRRRSRRAAAAAMVAFADALAEQRAARTHHHAIVAGSTATAIDVARDLDARLWARRGEHPDVFTVSLGVGDVVWQPSLSGADRTVPAACWSTVAQASVIPAVSVPVTVGAAARIALCGPHGAAVARSLLAQLAVQAGPAEWRPLIVSADPEVWAMWRTLPHASSTGAYAVVDEQGMAELLREAREDAAGERRHTVVLVDDVRLLAARTSPVRRFLATVDTAALILVTDSAGSVPALCTSLLVTAKDGRGHWTEDTTVGELPSPLRIAGLSGTALRDVVGALSKLTDPEDASSVADAIAADVPLRALLGATDPAAIAAAWSAATADVSPETPLGVAIDGVVVVDLVRDGPHALIGGTTGAGKSELLRSLVVGLAARLSPEQISFVLVDYKGGAAFDVCAPLPHVAGVVTDLDGRLTERVLRSLRAELTRREQILREHGAHDLPELRAAAGRPVVPRLVVVVDEFAAMVVEHADLLSALIGIAQRGRSLGVHLVLATQRPSGVISEDIRANTNLRIALRCADAADAMDVVGDAAPAALPRHRPGRAVMRLGPDELITFQSAHDTAGVVELVVDAVRLTGCASAPRPWCDPLPAVLSADIVPGAMGLCDLPDDQAQRPWTWSPASGNVVVAGAAGSGVTTTLLAAVLACVGAEDEPVEVFVIDTRRDERWAAVADHPRCAGVVGLHERERLVRMLGRLVRPPVEGVRRVLVVDGVAPLRLELETVELTDARAAFERVLTDASLGVTLLIGTDAPASVPASVVSRCAQRWVHHLHEPHDAIALGVPATHVPRLLVPGRIALAQGHAVTEAQVALPDLARVGRGPRDCVPVTRVDVLPALVPASGLSHPRQVDGVLSLPVGLRGDTLGEATVDVADGEHVLVIGPGRSGRSTVLGRVLDAWMQCHRTGWVGVATPRRSPLSAAAREMPLDLDAVPVSGPALIVVDDAELVDDPSGALTRLVAGRRPGLIVVAAGRAESLRQSYGHWTTGVRRSRLGLVMAGATEIDADLLGVTLPRWTWVPARPGLANLVADGTATLVQCAIGEVDARQHPRRSPPRALAAVS